MSENDLYEDVFRCPFNPELLITGCIRIWKTDKHVLRDTNMAYPNQITTIIIRLYNLMFSHSSSINLLISQLDELKVGDKIDYRYESGKFLKAKVCQKKGTNLQIRYKYSSQYDKSSQYGRVLNSSQYDKLTWCDYQKEGEINRFAEHGAISTRPLHRFDDFVVGKYVDINPTQKHPGWKTGQITGFDSYSGQLHVKYAADNPLQHHSYWTHLDNASELRTINRHYYYESDFDRNGIIYAFGTNQICSLDTNQKWKNPVDKNIVTVTPSSQWDMYWQNRNFVARKCNASNKTKNRQNSWIQIDFDKFKIRPTKYTLRHDWNSNYYIRNWNFEASNDGYVWDILCVHRDDTSINDAGQSHSWSITHCNKEYSMFKIQQIENNSAERGNCYELHCHGFEIYGHLREATD